MCSSALHQFFEFLEGDLAISILICLFDHVEYVVIAHFLSHSCKYLFEAFESDGFLSLCVENTEGLEHIFF